MRMPCLDSEREHRDEREDQRGGVRLVVAPESARHGEVHQAGDRDDDDGGQHGLGQMVEERHQKQRGQANDRHRDERGEAGLCAGGEVDHRAGEGAADRITAGDPGREIGRPQRDEFLVGIHFLPAFGRERLRDGNVLEKADEADREGERNQRQELGRGERGEREPRQSAWDLPDDAYAVARPEVESGDDGRADDDHDDRPALRQRLRQGRWECLSIAREPAATGIEMRAAAKRSRC